MIIKSSKLENRKSGIYKITNIINGKIYIGSTKTSFKKRYTEHIYDLNTNTHCNEHLQNAFDKYGSGNFTFEILEIIEDKSQIIPKEQYYLDLYQSYNSKIGYNILKNAFSSEGFKHSEETKNYLSNIKKGKKQHVNTYNAILKANIGSKRTLESRIKMSKAQKGKNVSKKSIELRLLKVKGKTFKNKRCIIKCDFNFNIISIFNNLKECSDNINMSMSNIRSICNGRTIQPKDYILMYEYYSLDWKRTDRKMELKWR
jgi:group I intron endonuclease